MHLTPEVFMALAVGAGPFIASWAWERWWKKADAVEEQKKLQEAEEKKSLQKSLDNLKTSIDNQFSELRQMFNKQDMKNQEFAFELKRLAEFAEEFKELKEELPKLIKHESRNIVEAEFLRLELDRRRHKES